MRKVKHGSRTVEKSTRTNGTLYKFSPNFDPKHKQTATDWRIQSTAQASKLETKLQTFPNKALNPRN